MATEKIFTVKIPKNIRDIPLEQFIRTSKPAIERKHLEILQAFREALIAEGYSKGNVARAAKAICDRFYLTPGGVRLTTNPFARWLKEQEQIPPKEPISLPPPGQTQAGKLLLELVNEMKLVKLSQAQTQTMLRELAGALHDGGHSGLKTAINRLSWFPKSRE